MESKILNDYLNNKNELDVERLIDDFYNYIYIVVKNSVNIIMTDEDIEEIISDTFLAIWKKSINLPNTTKIKPYLIGIIKNIIKNRYRKSEISFSISSYEEYLVSNINIQEIIEQNEQEYIIQKELKKLKNEEYQVFIMFYYESLSINEISQKLKYSNSKTKVILHRVRKKLKKILEDGGYGYGK